MTVDMDWLYDFVHREIDARMKGVVTEQDGTVTSYDGAAGKHYAKVQLQPGGQETGWIHVGEAHIGNGWGIVSGLQIGDQVTVRFQGGDLESGRIVGRLHSDVDQAPAVQSGEILLRHEDGRKVFMDQAGNMITSHPSGAQTTINQDGTVVAMAKPGKILYLGDETVTPGQTPTGNYGFVETTAGTSTSVKAKA